jgi:hypothetical protein
MITSIEIKEGKPTILIELLGNQEIFYYSINRLSDQQHPLPNIPFDVTVQLTSDQLLGGIKDAALFSSHLTFRVGDEKFVLETQSSKGKFKQEIEAEKLQSLAKSKSYVSIGLFTKYD